MKYRVIDINSRDGLWTDDILVMEKNDPDTHFLLYGWDEVGLFDPHLKNPVYVEVICDDWDSPYEEVK